MKITINIADDLATRLKREAAREDRTMSDLVESGLRLLLRPQEERLMKVDPYEAGKHLFGRYGSGRDDLSTNRKAILDEILRAKHRRRQGG